MLDWLNEFLAAIDAALAHGAALAIVIGLLVALAGTQYVKHLPIFPLGKWWIRSLSLPFGFVTTFFMWPDHQLTAVRIFLSLAVGLSAPYVYQLVTAILYWKWPTIEQRLSANPPPVQPTPGGA